MANAAYFLPVADVVADIKSDGHLRGLSRRAAARSGYVTASPMSTMELLSFEAI